MLTSLSSCFRGYASSDGNEQLIRRGLRAWHGSAQQAQSSYSILDRGGGGGVRSIITLTRQNTFQESEVEELLWRLESGPERQDLKAYARVLNACSNLKALALGRRVHACILKHGLDKNSFIGNHIVSMYARCGSAADARAVFDRLSDRNVFSWTAIITAYAKKGQCKETIRLLRLMQMDGVRPDRVLLVSVLDGCSSYDDLEDGQMIHDIAIESGLVSEVVVSNALINMYRKCGCPEAAQVTFDAMEDRTIISWTSAIAAQSQNARGGEALGLFRNMQLQGVRPNLITFAVAAEACDSPSFLTDGRVLHRLASENGFDTDVIVGSILVHMYVLCKSLEEARRAFEALESRSLVSWSTMIQAYSDHGLDEETFRLYHQMQLEGIRPDSVSYFPLLNVCDRPEHLENGRRVHSQLADRGFETEVLQNSLITMYGRCGDLDSAAAMFARMKKRDEVPWNAMFQAYGQNGYVKQAQFVFRQSLLAGMKPSKSSFATMLSICDNEQAARDLHANIVESGLGREDIVQTALLSAYGKNSCIEDASRIFESIPEWSVTSCNAMITAYAQQGQCREAMDLFRRMQLAGLKLTDVTFIEILDICAETASLPEGRFVHRLLEDEAARFQGNEVVANALVHMYSRCGKLAEARRVFKQSVNRDVVSWTGIIESFARHGYGDEALRLFYEMQQEGSKPNAVSFNCILAACSHAGLVREGCLLFESLRVQDYGSIAPSQLHYGCLIDLLGRSGQLDAAERFVAGLPAGESSMAWKVLLGACRNHGAVEIGKRAARQVLEGDPQAGQGYILLSSICVGGDGRICNES